MNLQTRHVDGLAGGVDDIAFDHQDRHALVLFRGGVDVVESQAAQIHRQTDHGVERRGLRQRAHEIAAPADENGIEQSSARMAVCRRDSGQAACPRLRAPRRAGAAALSMSSLRREAMRGEIVGVDVELRSAVGAEIDGHDRRRFHSRRNSRARPAIGGSRRLVRLRAKRVAPMARRARRIGTGLPAPNDRRRRPTARREAASAIGVSAAPPHRPRAGGQSGRGGKSLSAVGRLRVPDLAQRTQRTCRPCGPRLANRHRRR